MKRFIVIISFFSSVVVAMAVPSLVVKPLIGSECIKALVSVGKLVYSGDSLYVYDKAKTVVFCDLLANIKHIRFSDEQPSNPTSVDNIGKSALQVKVYPNPTQEILHVENVHSDMLRLYTIDGQLVATHAVDNGRAEINMSDLSAGNYLLLCGKEAYKVIKQ